MEGFHSDGMRIRKTEDYRKHFVQSACEMAVCWLKKWKYFPLPLRQAGTASKKTSVRLKLHGYRSLLNAKKPLL